MIHADGTKHALWNGKIYDMMMDADGITSSEMVMKGVKNEK